MLNQKANLLLENYQPEIKDKDQTENGFTVSQTVSAAAVLYESARNAVEFRADHLIRRAAIERILRRKLLTKSNGAGISEPLVRELLWAKYLVNGSISPKKIESVQKVINKYIALKNKVQNAGNGQKHGSIYEWLIGIASCEIEKQLAPDTNRDTLTDFVYQSLKDRLVIEWITDSKTKNIQTYIAVQRSYAQSDEAIIRFNLFITYFPNWINVQETEIDQFVPKFLEAYTEIENQIHLSDSDRIKNVVKKECPPFFVIRDIAEKYPEEFSKIIADRELTNEYAKKILTQRYSEIGDKLHRAAIRSIIYIFLTKMVFALILEVPFDLIMKKTNYAAIGINMLFPPLLMYLMTASINLPDAQNTKKIIDEIDRYLYDSNPAEYPIELKKAKSSSLIFTAVYFLMFIVIFGLIGTVLNKLGFNILSMLIFVFFVTLVAFFSYRVKLMTKDYVMKEKESVTGPLVDFLLLPILRVGQWLSGELAQINFIIFLFDFIIEAPFKAFFKVIEEWLHFLRTKKEEIIS